MSESLTNEQIEKLEGGIINVYVEKSITLSKPVPGMFSASEKMGMSLDIPEGLTADQTIKYIESQCSYYLNQWKNKLLGLR